MCRLCIRINIGVPKDIFDAFSQPKMNWAAKIELYLIDVSLKSIQSHGLRVGKVEFQWGILRQILSNIPF
jgi:hypothetical protein